MEIRAARKEDVPAILGLIRELAIYENAPNEVENTVEQLTIDLFEDKLCEAIVAVIDDVVVGFALFYSSYSTWKGRCIYLEDLYVQEAYRRHKIGDALFETVRKIAIDRKCKRMDWQVLDWNEPAIKFYEKKNALLDPEWMNGRLFF